MQRGEKTMGKINLDDWELVSEQAGSFGTFQRTYKRKASELDETQKSIGDTCDEVKEMLLEKNRKYGDSALNPKRIFSKASPMEQINVRIDDKLSRICSNQLDDEEDAVFDLLGYLILKRIMQKRLKADLGTKLNTTIPKG